MNGLIGTTVERNEFKNVSIVILAYLLDLPRFCTCMCCFCCNYKPNSNFFFFFFFEVDSLPNPKACNDFLLEQTNNMEILSM